MGIPDGAGAESQPGPELVLLMVLLVVVNDLWPGGDVLSILPPIMMVYYV